MTDEEKENYYKPTNEKFKSSLFKQSYLESLSSNENKKLNRNSSRDENSIKLEEEIKYQKHSSILESEVNSLKNSQRISNNSNKKENNNEMNKVVKYKKKEEKIISKKNKDIPRKDTIQTSKENIEAIEENENLNCRQRLTRFLEAHDKLFYIKLIIYILSFLSFFYYVTCTYVNSLFPSLNYIDFGLCTIYIIEHLINIILAHYFLFYIFSMESLILFLLEIPPFFSLLCKDYHLDPLYRFINITRVLRLLKASNIIDLFLAGEKNVKSQIIIIISTLITIVFIWAGVIQMLELEIVETQLKVAFDNLLIRNLKLRRHFHHYVYFVIVSLTTVGYGEIIPQTFLAEWMLIVLTAVILVVVPDVTSELINLSNAQTIYKTNNYNSSPDVPYIVIIGNIELESLKNFCKEYFHKDHGDGYRHIVILINKAPNKSMENFLNKEENNKFITYLQGDPMDNNDLLRADILNARSCIIFTNKNSLDPYSGDHQSLLLATFIKKFFYHMTLEKYFENCKAEENYYFSKNSIKKKIKSIFRRNKNVFRICLQLNRPESKYYYYSTLDFKYHKNMHPDKLLIIEHIKMNLLSKSCLTPGIIALISNLVISSSVENSFTKNEPEWLKEYIEGQQYEIYKYYNIEGDLLFYSFQELTQEIYNRFHGILIALEINYHGGTLVKLNPQTKESLIDVVYPSILSKTKNTSTNMGFENIDDQEGESLLENSEEELDAMNNLKKLKGNVNFKKIKINLYCISSDKNIIDDIKKLDEGKKKKNYIKRTITKQSSIKERRNTSYVSKRNLNISQRQLNDYSDSDSDSSDEIGGEESTKYLVDTGNNHSIEDEDLSNNYYILENSEKNYLYSNEIMRQGIKDRTDIKNHIIICGMHHELIHFILPLRNKYLPEKLLKWIVILAPSLPEEIHDSLSKFPKVIFIQGDPLYPENLFRANISTAAIAVILSSVSLNGDNDKDKEVYDIIGKEDDDDGYLGKDKSGNQKQKKINEEIIDSKALFIYKSIKKLNSSIQIITELLRTNDIEFLLSSRNLKKLYKDSFKVIKNLDKNLNNQSQIYDDNENNGGSLHYEHTPVYAAGEVYLPSIVDKITGQMFYNSNLLTILNLLLIGEKPPEKKADKKLAQLFDLKGCNLFLIPCEAKNESFSDMFKSLLIKYNMISVALYRKNEQENFYYVYTNPKKTTLIRDTDMVFVLSCTENIIAIYEKLLMDVKVEQKYFEGFLNEEKDDYDNNKEDNPPSFFKILQDAVFEQFRANLNTNKNNIINNNNKPKDYNYKNKDQNRNFKRSLFSNIFKNKGRDIKNKLITKKGEKLPFIKGKYNEIDNMQNRLDKAMDKLKEINIKSQNIENDVEYFVKEEITNELSLYVTKTGKK